MPKYRKKPVVIEAMQLKWETWNEMCDFAEVPYKSVGIYVTKEGSVLTEHTSDSTIGLSITTLEGTMIAKENDWVIKGVNGELYPCKPDIFEKSYELVK